MTAIDIEPILKEFEHAGRDQLIPLLQRVQEAEGYLSQAAITRVSQHLRLPESKIYGVATFYNQFRFQTRGKYTVQVCRGTACHVRGSAAILEALKQELDIEPGATTKDGLFSLEVVACIGACGLAPVIAIGDDFHAKVTPEKVAKIISEYRRKAESDDK